MPPLHGEFTMEPNFLHIWPRGNFMLIALPNPDKSFTCTLFFPFEGETSFESLNSDAKVMDFFSDNFSDAAEMIPDYVAQFKSNPTSSLVTIRCAPWRFRNCLLIGDAAHAIVPFYGQGMNAAFEDCHKLVELGEQLNFDWNLLLEQFSRERKKDGDAIADLALRNFIEMRDQVADEQFLERKKADAKMNEVFGEEWVPLYSMVTFSDYSYHYAKTRGYLQEEVLKTAQKRNILHEPQKVIEILREQLKTS
jgi:kynurenine 3-monooxygenase